MSEAFEKLYEQIFSDAKTRRASRAIASRNAGKVLKTGVKMFWQRHDGQAKDYEICFPRYGISCIAGLTGGGKSTLLANFALRLIEKGHQGVFISLEEPDFEIMAKMISAYSVMKNVNYSTSWANRETALAVDRGDLPHGIEKEFYENIDPKILIADATKQINEADIASPAELFYPQVIMDMIRWHRDERNGHVDFVMIDYVQLLETDPPSRSSADRMRTVMTFVKNLAALGVAVIISAQMKRECALIDFKDWVPEQLRDGSDLEQSLALMLAARYDKESGKLFIRGLKNRYGPLDIGGAYNINWENFYLPDRSTPMEA